MSISGPNFKGSSDKDTKTKEDEDMRLFCDLSWWDSGTGDSGTEDGFIWTFKKQYIKTDSEAFITD